MVTHHVQLHQMITLQLWADEDGVENAVRADVGLVDSQWHAIREWQPRLRGKLPGKIRGEGAICACKREKQAQHTFGNC